MRPKADATLSTDEYSTKMNGHSLDLDHFGSRHHLDSNPSDVTHNGTGHHEADSTQPIDLLLIGLGPSTLAILIALYDAHTRLSCPRPPLPRILVLEREAQFSWHAGMQLPDSKMQISFLKDLATPRDPTSSFTFLNYLKQVERLEAFINLSTFLPSREEYEGYLGWCAAFFERMGIVRYGVEVSAGAVKVGDRAIDGRVRNWDVIGRENDTGLAFRRRAHHVVIAVGGRASIPRVLRGLKGVVHSSMARTTIAKIEETQRLRESRENDDSTRRLRLVVIGGGQSGAEIFNHLCHRFPLSGVKLVLRDRCLRPSDDSPFVNEIFSPSMVSQMYSLPTPIRSRMLARDRVTNYGVVRNSLLEQLYERMYMQRVRNPNEREWRCQILGEREAISASQTDTAISLKLRQMDGSYDSGNIEDEEIVEADHVFAATGYTRDVHDNILEDLRGLLPAKVVPSTNGSGLKERHREVTVEYEQMNGGGPHNTPVDRNYRVQYDENKVDASRAGIWIQGCCEETHGLSDTLLSIAAVRGGELVKSIFGNDLRGLRAEGTFETYANDINGNVRHG